MHMRIKHSGAPSMISDHFEDDGRIFVQSVCGLINVHVGGYGYLAFLEAGVLDKLMIKVILWSVNNQLIN